MTEPTTPHFTDPAVIARYAEGPRRNVPALGRLLVVGAGGG